MEPLTWVTIAGLMVRYGVPLTDYIIAQWRSGKEVTPEDWAKAKELANVTPEMLLDQVLASKGISKDDPRAKELLELIKAPTPPLPPA